MIIIVISEKYLDFTAFNNDDKLQIPGHTLIPWYEEGSGVPLFKFKSLLFQPFNITYDLLKQP